MDRLQLEANYRSDMSKSHMKKIRRDGYVTASIIGHDTESISVEVRMKDIADQVRHSDSGIMSLFDMTIKDAPTKADGTVIIKDFHKNPLSRKVVDVTFQRVSMKEKIHVSAPVVLVGESVGAKDGGIIELVVNQLEISCLPGNIPNRIEIDITDLAIGHHIRVADIVLGSEITVLSDAEALVCNCLPPHVSRVQEEADTAAAAAAPAAPATEEKSGE